MNDFTEEDIKKAVEAHRKDSGAVPNELWMGEESFRCLAKDAGWTEEEIERFLSETDTTE